MAHKGAWVKFRRPMSKYPKTEQQKKVEVGGEMIRRACKGKTGKDFIECRSRVLKCSFHDEECDADLKDVKREILEKD